MRWRSVKWCIKRSVLTRKRGEKLMARRFVVRCEKQYEKLQQLHMKLCGRLQPLHMKLSGEKLLTRCGRRYVLMIRRERKLMVRRSVVRLVEEAVRAAMRAETNRAPICRGGRGGRGGHYIE